MVFRRRNLAQCRIEMPLELGKNCFVALTHDVRQHIEATTVGHTNHCPIEFARQHRQDGVRIRMALSAPSVNRFVPTYFVAKRSNARCIESLKDPVSVARTEQATSRRAHPFLFFSVLDVHVLNADFAAAHACSGEPLKIAKTHLRFATNIVGQEFTVKVPDGQAVGCGISSFGFEALSISAGRGRPSDGHAPDGLE